MQAFLAWAFKFLFQCQQTKKEILVLKLDFEKSFNMIDHDTILEILATMGFGQRCLN